MKSEPLWQRRVLGFTTRHVAGELAGTATEGQRYYRWDVGPVMAGRA